MKILVTGGAGYIGSHALVELYSAGYTADVVDNLCNSCKESFKRVAELCNVEEIPFFCKESFFVEAEGLGVFSPYIQAKAVDSLDEATEKND